tara:strand:- start:903 stop:1733 length:831 start_codon:yes stop_codon:yes gene_type:complete
MLDPSIGLALFAYNRPSHLRRVLIALEDYKIKNINVFIDGPKNTKDKVCQEEIVFMLKTNKNLKSKIMLNKKNKGLAYSLINGITKMSKKYKSIIILEDDCVPRREFFDFVLKNLKKYNLEKKISAICGYQFPELHEKKSKILKSIFLNNFMPWGWAIWSEKWIEFIINKKNYPKNLKKSKIISKLEKKIKNKKNIWTLDFIKYCFINKKYFIFPNKSLIKNIGFDGTGINSQSTFKFNTFYTKSNKIDILKKISIDKKKDFIQQKTILKRINLFY